MPNQHQTPPSYDDLLAERDRLMQHNAQLISELCEVRAAAAEYWQVVESVACGETMQCVVCGKQHPCCCDKGR